MIQYSKKGRYLKEGFDNTVIPLSSGHVFKTSIGRLSVFKTSVGRLSSDGFMIEYPSGPNGEEASSHAKIRDVNCNCGMGTFKCSCSLKNISEDRVKRETRGSSTKRRDAVYWSVESACLRLRTSLDSSVSMQNFLDLFKGIELHCE